MHIDSRSPFLVSSFAFCLLLAGLFSSPARAAEPTPGEAGQLPAAEVGQPATGNAGQPATGNAATPATGEVGQLEVTVAPLQADLPGAPPGPGKVSKQKSPALAVILPVGGIAAMAGLAYMGEGLDIYSPGWENFSFAMGFGALIVAPAFGQFYAGNYKKGLITTGLRAGGTVMGISGLLMNFCVFTDCSPEPLGYALSIGGAAIILGTTIYDLIDAPTTIMRQNNAVHSLKVMPTLLPPMERRADARPLPGLVITGAF